MGLAQTKALRGSAAFFAMLLSAATGAAADSPSERGQTGAQLNAASPQDLPSADACGASKFARRPTRPK